MHIDSEFVKIKEHIKGIDSNLDNINISLVELIEKSEHVKDDKERASFSELATQITKIIKQGDKKASDTLTEFSIEVVKSKNSLIDTIEKSGISEQEKAEGISKLNNFSLKNIQEMLAESLIPFSGEVSQNILVSLTAEIVLKLLKSVILAVIPGAPVVSLIVELLL